MGMFDGLRCEYALPDGYVPVDGYDAQTKSFDNLMELYLIDRDGYLRKQLYDMIPVGEPKQHPFLDTWKDWQEYKYVNLRWSEPLLYHGDVVFYYYYSPPDDQVKIDKTYVARFTNGKLQGIQVGYEYDLSKE